MKKRLLALLCVTILVGNMALPARAEEEARENNLVTGEYVEGQVIVRATEEFVNAQSDTYRYGHSKSDKSYRLPSDYKIETLFDLEEMIQKYQEYISQFGMNDFSYFSEAPSGSEDQSDQFLMIRSEDKTVEEMMNELEDIPGISYVEPDYIIETCDVSEEPVNDFRYEDQWFLQSSSEVTGAPDVPFLWKNGVTGSEDLVVAVLDTGIDYTNPDLADNMWQDPETGTCGYDFSPSAETEDGDDDPMDVYGHGTHVAGIIGAQGNNEIGVSGVNQHIKLAALRVLGDNGSGSISGGIKAYEYMIDKKLNEGVNFIAANNSWGGVGTSLAFQEVADYAGECGIVSVFSSGNDKADRDNYSESVTSGNEKMSLTVNASDSEGNASSYSNFGKNNTDLYAPGDEILSTVPVAQGSCDPLTIEECGIVWNNSLSEDPGEHVRTFELKDENAVYETDAANQTVWNENDQTLEWRLNGKEAGLFYGMEWNLGNLGECISNIDDIHYLAFRMGVQDSKDQWYGRYLTIQVRTTDSDEWMTVSGDDYGCEYGACDAVSFHLTEEMKSRIDWGQFTIRIIRKISDVDIDCTLIFTIDAVGFGTNVAAYDYESGTSMAAPVVTGSVALLSAWYQSRGKDYDTPEALSEIRARIAGGVTRTEEMQDLCVSGGYLNLEKAMTTPYPVLDSIEQNEDGSAVIEGYFFGETGTLKMDGLIITDIEEWTEHSVSFQIPEGTKEGKHTFRITNLTIGEDQYGEDSFLLQEAAGGAPSDSHELFEQLAKPDFNALGIAIRSNELPQNLVELEGKLYVAGSFVKTKEDGTSCPAVLVYDVGEETWDAFELHGISPEAEVNMVAGEHELYFIFNEELFTVYKYLPDTGEKIKISEDPNLSGHDNVVFHSSYLVYGSDIWMIGGMKYDEDYGTYIPVKDVMLLNIADSNQDPALNTWRKGSELNHARAMAGAEIVDGTLIVAGGENKNDSWVYSTEIWDGTKWNEAAEFPTVYENQQVTAASGTFGENMIVSGMFDDEECSGDTFVYNKTSDTWSLTASKKLSDTKVYYADGVVYSDYFYVYGLILFNNDYDVLWNRVSVNELIEEDPVDPGTEDPGTDHPGTITPDPDDNIIIKIVHTNDIHARVTDSSEGIGVERLKTIIDSWTSDAAMSTVIDSGDLFHGQPIATLSKGESIAKITKALGYDLMTAGNHDWSYGKDRLKELAEMADIEMLCGNVVTDSGESFFEDEYAVYESDLSDGPSVKYGVFGTIDPQLYTSTTPSNVEGLTFTDQVAYAKESARHLKEDLGCDIVIGLTHTLGPEELAGQVDGVDIWLCGHEHINLDETVTTPDGGTAYVIESGYYLQNVSLIELECFTDENNEFSGFELTHTVLNEKDAEAYARDPEMTALLNEINDEQEEILNTVVGQTPEYLDGDWYNLRIGETNLGRVVADAYLLETGADVAFENAGGIRASIKAGDVTYGDIIGVSPYGNYIVTKKLTGAQLLDVFETSLDIQVQCIEAYERGDDSAWPSSSGSYLQFGGVTVEYDLSQPAGSRVVSAKVQGEPLDLEKLYTVATNNYASASNYYDSLATAEETGQFRACDEALVSFFEQDEEAIAKTLSNQAMIPAEKCQHTDTEIRDQKDASCTEEGYTGDVYCKNCGELIESGEPILKTSHTYKDGICTVCKAKNPSANPSEKEKTDTQASAASPKTGDENHAGVFGAMLLLSAMTIVAFRKKKSMVS